jgi:GNAT superfamily N-acetyltransferase
VTHDPAAYRVRPARDRDIRGVMSLLDEASIWLGEKGLDQGTLHVVEHGPLLVATITVDGFADADFWKVEDDVLSGLYAHRMAVARREAGRRLGSAMLDWAGERALACGRTLLRLDAWVTNGALHTYYKNLGFEHVRTEEVADRGSGALFERAATLRLGQGPALVDVPR